MIKKLQAKGNSDEGEVFQRVTYERAKTHEIKDYFLREIQESMHDSECWQTDDERNDKGMSITHNKNLTDGRDHHSGSDTENKKGWEGLIKARVTWLHFTGHWSLAMAGLGSGDASFFTRSQKSRLLMGSLLKLKCWPLQNILNPLKDIKFLTFSAEKKIYTDTVWNIIENMLAIS